MIKKIFLPAFFLFSLVTFAQQSTSSPYSFYGIGDIRFKGTVENRLMGGVSVFTDSIHLNLQNPASYSGLKLSTFTLGASFDAVKLKSYQGNDKAQRTTVDYLAIGLPVMHRGTVAFGLVPYSAVGYKVRSDDDVAGVYRRYEGKGGVNKAFIGYGFQINNNWSVGADFGYNFGRIETNNYKYLAEAEYGVRENNTSQLSGFTFKAGTMYHKMVNKRDYYASLSYMPTTNLKSTNLRDINTVLYSTVGTATVIDTFPDVETRIKIKLPGQLAFGIGFGQAKKWLIGTELILKQSSDFGNRFSDTNQSTYENGFQYSLGGYFVPNYNAFSNYLKKITYRAGLRYEKTGLIISNESIKDYSVTGGFGFPLGGLFSNLNLGVEYGKRGTIKANLVEENYTNVFLSLSLNDKWFVQRKFD